MNFYGSTLLIRIFSYKKILIEGRGQWCMQCNFKRILRFFRILQPRGTIETSPWLRRWRGHTVRRTTPRVPYDPVFKVYVALPPPRQERGGTEWPIGVYVQGTSEPRVPTTNLYPDCWEPETRNPNNVRNCSSDTSKSKRESTEVTRHPSRLIITLYLQTNIQTHFQWYLVTIN